MGQRTLKRIGFFAIARQLRETNRTQADIAADYNVSSSTVSVINQAGSWENYLAGKTAVKPIRAARALAQKPTKLEAAKAAGLNPRTREDRLNAAGHPAKSRIPRHHREANKLAADLKKLEKTPTRDEFKQLSKALHDRQDVLLARVRQAERHLGRNGLKSDLALFISVGALVLSIIALAN